MGKKRHCYTFSALGVAVIHLLANTSELIKGGAYAIFREICQTSFQSDPYEKIGGPKYGGSPTAAGT